MMYSYCLFPCLPIYNKSETLNYLSSRYFSNVNVWTIGLFITYKQCKYNSVYEVLHYIQVTFSPLEVKMGNNN